MKVSDLGMEVSDLGNGSIRSGEWKYEIWGMEVSDLGMEVSDLGNGSIKIRRMEMLI